MNAHLVTQPNLLHIIGRTKALAQVPIVLMEVMSQVPSTVSLAIRHV